MTETPEEERRRATLRANPLADIQAGIEKHYTEQREKRAADQQQEPK